MLKLFDVDWIRSQYNGKTEVIIVSLLFAPIFLTGLIGNLWLIWAILRNRVPRTSSTIFTLCLALGDLLPFIGLFPILFSSYISTSPSKSSDSSSWLLLTSLMCRFSETIRDISVTLTALTLIAMALDRYLAVLSAVTWMQKQVDRRHRILAWAAVAFIWSLSIGLALPTFFSTHLTRTNLDSKASLLICTPSHVITSPAFFSSYNIRYLVIGKFVLLYMVPILITSYCYAAVARQLTYNVKVRLCYRKTQQERVRRKAQFTVRLAFALVILFLLCFLPHHLVSLWYYVHPNQFHGIFWQTARITAFMSNFINSVLNPIIICSTSCHLKKILRKKFTFLKNF